MLYLSASEVMIHEEVQYQVYIHLAFMDISYINIQNGIEPERGAVCEAVVI